tara:strand:- start:218 stop:412 length:195 start_codon:yes stop_codon:yes gene_type:complete
MSPKWIRWYLDSGEYNKSIKRCGAFQRACEDNRKILGEALEFSEWWKTCPKHLLPKDPPKGLDR